MIYSKSTPTTPSNRFKSVILNPVGCKIKKKIFYKNHQNSVGRHFGKKVCLRRKKTSYSTKFNLTYGLYQNKCCIISEISLARRHKTFVGLVTYSDGSLSSIPLFNGAFWNQIIKVCPYSKNSRILNFSHFKAGYIVPIAYLHITTCVFSISIAYNTALWFCRAAGTFCVIMRYNMDKAYCTIKIPSAKYFLVSESSYAMLGRNANVSLQKIRLGKAGVNIKKGFRPVVRGVAKNPVDHPHGGRTKSNSPERTPWGKIAKFNK